MSEHANFAFHRVLREHLHDAEVQEFAQRLELPLPEGEALNNIVVAEELVPDDGIRPKVQFRGVAILTQGKNAYTGEVILKTDKELNGARATVEQELVSRVARIANTRQFYTLNISDVEKTEEVDGNGQKTVTYKEHHLRTMHI